MQGHQLATTAALVRDWSSRAVCEHAGGGRRRCAPGTLTGNAVDPVLEGALSLQWCRPTRLQQT